ncbi:MAG TPA: EamA family transporter [Terriglobales bacterium]|jgi:multidrug transporter EmrE-like cation transporter|nr:EamA family transporter [Terriglobales bacterium]
MFLGYLFAVLAMLSIGMTGILSKLSDRYDCTPLNTSLIVFGGSSILMGLYVSLVQKATLVPPAMVSGTAIFFGVIAILAFGIFLYGLQFGKLTSSWIFLNLSAVVPAVLSILIYHEAVTLAKILVLGLVVASIVLLWKDKQKEGRQVSTGGEVPAHANVKMWVTTMFAAFLLNGACVFGLRVLAGRGLAQQYTPVYLVYWYLGGFVFGLLGLIKTRHKLTRANAVIGSLMCLSSIGGQFFMGLALSSGIPGSVVFMLGMGASMCVVVLGGVLFFQERVGIYAKVGIAVGLAAAVLLSTTG